MKESMQQFLRVEMQTVLCAPKSVFAVLKTGLCEENRRKLSEAKRDF